MRHPTRFRRSRLVVQALEHRDTPAGTVTASLTGTTLTLTGDDSDNSVTITQTAAGAFNITGRSGTTIIGGPNFNGVTNLAANFGAGNDAFRVASSVDLGSDGLDDISLGAVTINGGDGNNSTSIQAAGKLELASLSVTGGDGQDVVGIGGGVGEGSKITGSIQFNLGIGVNSQVPPYLDTVLTMNDVDVTGRAGLKFRAGEGNEFLNFTRVNVTGALNADGGAGSLSLTTTGGTIGSLSLKSVGYQPSNPPNGTSWAPTGTTITGAVALKSGAGVGVTASDVTTGPITIAAGTRGCTVCEFGGTSTVNGNLKVTGFRHTVIVDAGGDLTVKGDLSETGPSAMDLDTGDATLNAANIKLTGSLINFGDYDNDQSTAGAVTLSGAMTLTGVDVYYTQYGGTISVAGGIVLKGSSSATFGTGEGFYNGALGAQVTASSLTIKALDADYDQTDGVITIGSGGLAVQGGDSAGFGTSLSNGIGGEGETTIRGPLVVQGKTGDVTFSAEGDQLQVTGDATIGAPGLNRIWLESATGVDVDGNLTATGATGDNDWFLAWGPLAVGGNLSVDLGNGANDIETGTQGGATVVKGNMSLTTGDGSDTLYLARLAVTGTTTVKTGAGSDVLYLLSGTTLTGEVSVDLGAGADQFFAGVALPDPFNPGTNIVDAGPVEFDGQATVKLGNGNDKLELGVNGDPNGKVVFGPTGHLTVDGGANQDTFDAGADQFPAGNVTATGFELP